MKILIITPDYPDHKRNGYTFVKQLVDMFARGGHKCCVIAPYSVSKNRSFVKFSEIQELGNGVEVPILRPNYLSFSNINIAGFQLSLCFRSWALNWALRYIPFKPDVIYAHFWRSGREIYPYAKKKHIPLFVACGESVIPQNDINPKYQEFYDYVSGLICVSTKNMEDSIANGMTKKEHCLLAPNAINPNVFYRKDQSKCRNLLGFPQDSFIVAFCGTLKHSKGVKKLSNAIRKIQGKTIYSVFIGRDGGELPACNNILFRGEVAHQDVATYLSTADVFVLPTLHEGCSNAIIEAMACGLPIISSDMSFNKDILNENNSILIDPYSEEAIAKAIEKLYENVEMRKRLSEGALDSVTNLDIETRAKSIITFIKKRI